MKHNTLKWFGLLVVLSMLLTLTPAALAGPAEDAGSIARRTVSEYTLFKAEKFREHLRVPRDVDIMRLLQKDRFLPQDATPEQVEAAVQEFLTEFLARNPTTPNPEKFRQLMRNERLAAQAGMSPKAMGLAVEQVGQILAVPVEFAGTDTFMANVPDPANGCMDVEVTFTGPLHNEIAVDPRDNFIFYTDDFTPEVYDEIFFGVGPDAGIIAHHPGLGDVDLRGLTMANYYLEQSEGAFMPEGSVYPKWLQSAHSEAYFGADSCETGSHGVRTRELVRETVDLVNADDPNFPWQYFDANGDGEVDNYSVIHAGLGQEAGGGAQGDFSIWSHAASVDWPTGYLACSAGSAGCPDRNIYVHHYSMDPETADVGVAAEEYGHAFFGLPDIYTTDRQTSVADWAIMEAGAWMGPDGGAGMQPAPFPGWFRYVIGWWDPVTVNYDDPGFDLTIGQHSLRPEGTEQGLKINLPDAVRWLYDPYSGDYMRWGNQGDLMDNLVYAAVDLTGYAEATLGIQTYYEIETGWDFGFVQVSTDGGATWTSLENEYTTYDHDPGIIENALDNLPGLTGHVDDWTYMEFDVTPYAGQEIYMGFRYVTDWATTEKGFFVDDITITADGTEIFFDDAEAGMGGWTTDPADGWIMTTGTDIGPQYYMVEWRNDSGFDHGTQYAYQFVYYDPPSDYEEVDRAPYTLPGMLLWYRNTLYAFDYTLGDAWYDDPSWGAKHALLVVDSHPDPLMWDDLQYPEWAGLPVGVNLSGRLQPGDAVFGLNNTNSWTLRRGYDLDDYQDAVLETKTWDPLPPVRNFHDYLGYTPGMWCCDNDGYVWWWDIDASCVIPAEGNYSTRITYADGSPAVPLYGVWGVLGSGNPGDDNVQFGVNLCVQDQAADGSWGKVYFASAKFGPNSALAASTTEPLPGEELEFVVMPENLGGGAEFFTFVPLNEIPGDLILDSLTNGAFPIFGNWTSAQVAALYAEGGAEAVQALAAEQGLPFAGIGWIGNVPAGVNEIFRFKLWIWPWAAGAQFDMDAGFYLCGDHIRTLRSDGIEVQIPEPVTVTFAPSMDAHVSAWQPDDNFGGADAFSVRQPGVMNSLLFFGDGAIPQIATVDSATLKLYPTYRTNSNDLYLSVYPLEEGWGDGDVTWNTAPAAGDTAAATMVLSGVDMPIELDITALVQQWVTEPWANYGLMLKGDGSKSVEYTFMASEFGGMWPELEVTYH